MDTGPTASRVTGVRRLNANTYVPGHGSPWAPTMPRIELAQAYRVALGLHHTLPVTNEPGYRLIQVGATSHAWIELSAQPDGFAIVGRHSCSNLQLDGDPEVALRHLLVRAEAGVDGAPPTLRVLDLHTHLGFQLEGGSRERSAVIRGPVALHVGRHTLVAIPSLAIDLPEELPPVVVEMPASSPYRDAPRAARTLSLGSGTPVGLKAPGGAVLTGETPKPAGPVARDTRWTHVSLYGRPPSLHDLKPLGDDELTSSPSSARLGLERHGGHAGAQSVEVADTELDTGVLIGRASKCDRRFARLLDDKVSRTHLLILRDGRETSAYDLASTNGTYLEGKRRRRFTLPDAGATLSIGLGGARMRWHPPGGVGA